MSLVTPSSNLGNCTYKIPPFLASLEKKNKELGKLPILKDIGWSWDGASAFTFPAFLKIPSQHFAPLSFVKNGHQERIAISF